MFHVKHRADGRLPEQSWRKWFHVKHRGGVLMRMNVSRETAGRRLENVNLQNNPMHQKIVPRFQ